MRSRISFRAKSPTAGPRSLFIVHCSLFIALILAGCTEPVSTPESLLPTPTPPPSPTVQPTPTREPRPLITTLKLWLPEELDPYGEGPGAGILTQQLADLSKTYPDLQVEVTVKRIHGRGGIIDFLRTAREAAPSTMPDLVVVAPSDLETMASSGLIQPLDDLLSPADLADCFPFATEMGTVEGKTMGFVLGADLQLLAYRRDALDSPPTSWTKVITPPVSFLFPTGGDQQGDDATLVQYMAAGGRLVEPEGTPHLDEEVLVSVLDFYSSCVGTGAISPTVVLDIADTGQSWEQLKAGAGDIAVVQAGHYWTDAASGEDFAFTSIPTRDGRPFSIARGGWAIALVAEDPERQGLAMTLFNWLISPDHNAQWTRATGYMPSRRSALRKWESSSADQAALQGVLEAAIAPPPAEVTAAVEPAIQVAVTDVLRKRATPKEAAAAAVKLLEE